MGLWSLARNLSKLEPINSLELWFDGFSGVVVVDRVHLIDRVFPQYRCNVPVAAGA